MDKTQRIIIAIVAVVIVAGGVVWFTSSQRTAAPANTPPANTETETETEVSPGDIAATITYDGNEFELSIDKIVAGTSVKVLNTSTDQELQFASDPHPTHTANPELNQGTIAPGESKTFVLTTKGTWGFHNHLNAQQKGSITVE